MKKIKFLCVLSWILTIAHAFSVPLDTSPPTNKTTLSVRDLLSERSIRLIVIRHGEALHNLNDLMSSTRSPGVYLTEKGEEQVKLAAQRLSSQQIDFVYVSPVYRTLQTAQILTAALKIPFQKVKVEEDLREQFFGEFENRTYDEYVAYFPSIDHAYLGAAPGGEAGTEVFARTEQLLKKIVTDHSHETILLVTHAFNCLNIHKCLEGTIDKLLGKAEFKIYDYRSE